ncbi:hypothetical protein C0991_007907 [Blastosporella zonata]|nr:hypothetical protein C0991_007907 [Blastosporella zonata]
MPSLAPGNVSLILNKKNLSLISEQSTESDCDLQNRGFVTDKQIEYALLNGYDDINTTRSEPIPTSTKDNAQSKFKNAGVPLRQMHHAATTHQNQNNEHVKSDRDSSVVVTSVPTPKYGYDAAGRQFQIMTPLEIAKMFGIEPSEIKGVDVTKDQSKDLEVWDSVMQVVLERTKSLVG